MSSVASHFANKSEEADQFAVASGRARVMSAVRVTLHGAVIAALVLTALGVPNLFAVVLGLSVGVAFALRSRRVGLRFTPYGIEVNNYFRSYRIHSLRGCTLHLYLRNRIELQPTDGRQFVLQSATLMGEADREAIIEAVQERGASIVSASSTGR